MSTIKPQVMTVKCNTCSAAVRCHWPTHKTIDHVFCTPLCKIKSLITSMDEEVCWVYKKPTFTWQQTTYSIPVFIYEYYFNRRIGARNIGRNCANRFCANPYHMLGMTRSLTVEPVDDQY
jgi:hypothetical protein